MFTQMSISFSNLSQDKHILRPLPSVRPALDQLQAFGIPWKFMVLGLDHILDGIHFSITNFTILLLSCNHLHVVLHLYNNNHLLSAFQCRVSVLGGQLQVQRSTCMYLERMFFLTKAGETREELVPIGKCVHWVNVIEIVWDLHIPLLISGIE